MSIKKHSSHVIVRVFALTFILATQTHTTIKPIKFIFPRITTRQPLKRIQFDP